MHNFNVYYRGNPDYEVVAFTATQIPGIGGRTYPPELAGKLYPKGIPIYEESELENLIKKFGADETVFSYSDSAHATVMHLASRTIAAGANFRLLGYNDTTVKSTKPLLSVCAVRTGCGKSQTSRKLVKLLKEKTGKKVVAIRHPMPYGDLAKQAVQRFASYSDLDKHKCTIEEREEYEPFIDLGLVIYAGVDYEKILREAEREADIIFWDGGNNDLPFYKTDFHIVLADPHRLGDEMNYHPGEANLRMANVVLIPKTNTAKAENVKKLEATIKSVNPNAKIVKGSSILTVEKEIRGKRVLCIEDGPTTTHGGMKYGAASLAAEMFGAGEIVDAEKSAVGSIKELYPKFGISKILPAMGYSDLQIKELQETINKSNADIVLSGTPIDLNRVIKVNKPIVRVRYELDDAAADELYRYAKQALKL
jgi:predicted GTPase